PPEKIRFHTCYGINMGPRIHDMELKDIVDLILKIRAGAYSFEAANPRHEHEWKVWKNVKLPDGKILIPGVISHSTILVEHPELIADRIIRYAEIVGRENVIAGSDCGFATFAGSKEVHPSIVWAKLKALSDGAQLASKQLWRNSRVLKFAMPALAFFERCPAVDDEFNSSDVAALVAGKINRGPGDIPGVAAESHWNLPIACAPHFLDVASSVAFRKTGALLHHRGLHQSR